ncbi:ABC transporter substrate-binding protein [Streptosporangium sp. DT93]|uniref:ABC transporter substrate-binding protein n=1 Tax=Streptosporangium sp. DT93 TaxID=3393428 RepID=UPI003CEF970B
MRPDRLLRRGVLGLLVAGLMTVSAACGSSAPAQEGPASSGAAPAASPSAAGTKTLQTVNGAVEVPAAPQRVVSLFNTTAELLELGVKPVGVLQEFESDYAPEDWAELQKIPVVGENETAINYEQLLSLNPDLIISTQRRDEDFGYKKLSEIAPTVFIVTDNPAEVREALPKIAEAVGKEDVLTAKIAEYKAKVADIKSRHADVLAKTTWDYAEGGPEGFVANSPVSWPGLFMEEAGLKFSEVATAERENRGVRLSFEQISRLKDTSAILYGAGPDGKPDPATGKLLEQGSWKLLPAAKEGRVYPISYGYQYSYKGALAIVGQLDAILSKLS